jgi:hypothetical protein
MILILCSETLLFLSGVTWTKNGQRFIRCFISHVRRAFGTETLGR